MTASFHATNAKCHISRMKDPPPDDLLPELLQFAVDAAASSSLSRKFARHGTDIHRIAT
jgi:hypothetical protein